MGPYYSDADLNDKPISDDSILVLENLIGEGQGSLACELKEDGFRCQAHIDRNNVMLFSRGATYQVDCFPEIVNALQSLNLSQTIIDGELRGIQGKYAGFKDAQKRARYAGRIKEEKIKEYLETEPSEHPLQFVAFDILMTSGVSLIGGRNDSRREILEELILQNEIVIPIERRIFNKSKEIITAYKQLILKEKYEGLVLKQPNSEYVPGDKTHWVKLKKFEPLDLVIIGISKGAENNVQALVASYNSEKNVYQSLGLINLSKNNPATNNLFENDVLELVKFTESKPDNVEVGNRTPDKYVIPSLVLEVRVMNYETGKDFACSIDGKAKYSLRIAYIKSIRDDKRANQASTTEFVAKRYQKQK